MRPGDFSINAGQIGLTLQLYNLDNNLKKAKSREDYLHILQELEPLAPGIRTTTIWASLVVPTTLTSRSVWSELLSDLPLDAAATSRLLDSGFAPLELAVQWSLRYNPEFQDDSVLFIDLDYGVLLYESDGQLHARAVDQANIAQYTRLYPILDNDLGLMLSIGAFRGHWALHGRVRGNSHQVQELSVTSRDELDNILTRLMEWLEGHPEYEIWFRGQTQDHLLKDLTVEAADGICPWRGLRDTSLPPTLYRYLRDTDDLRQYSSFCIELVKLASFIEMDLDIPPFDVRQMDEAVGERLDNNWSVVEPTSTWYMPGYQPVSRDYHFNFRALQRSFFLQHYGLPSTILDLTEDIDVALFFAQQELVNGRYQRVSVGNKQPIIYVFLLHKDLDLFLRSAELSEHYGLLRPLRQRCGLLAGASLTQRNRYCRFISLKIYLDAPIEYADLSAAYLFPPREEDRFLDQLLRYCDEAKIERMKPFVILSD